MLNWASQFSILIYLDSNDFQSPSKKFECLLACEAVNGYVTGEYDSFPDPFMKLNKVYNDTKDWIFGHISYDLKNNLEPKLTSGHPVKTGFPVMHFFTPATVCYINNGQTYLTIETFGDPELIYGQIKSFREDKITGNIPALSFNSVISKQQYLETIEQLRAHIADGDCYEINFCNEGFCEQADIVPMQVFNALNTLSPAPFAAYYTLYDKHLMCASPERYLLKTGNKLLSQPMKGTARRDADAHKDQQIIEDLRSNLKERAENVMITDLVRNDLARCCEPGSVVVNELFGIYTFPQVHQMVSSVSGTIKPGKPFTDAICYSFPMGSMTGAPKFKVMQLIEEYEHSRRELFSGSVGYVTPEGDFDFNVIIRSLFYNATSKYLCYQTGGAITYDSIAEQEWEETRLKAWALERIFSGDV